MNTRLLLSVCACALILPAAAHATEASLQADAVAAPAPVQAEVIAEPVAASATAAPIAAAPAAPAATGPVVKTTTTLINDDGSVMTETVTTGAVEEMNAAAEDLQNHNPAAGADADTETGVDTEATADEELYSTDDKIQIRTEGGIATVN